jgi:hypothetical protein
MVPAVEVQAFNLHQQWPAVRPVLGEQFAADGGRRAHFAVGLGRAHCLANDSTIICVEQCVRSDGLAIRCSEVVDFAYQLAVIVEALHHFLLME